VLLMRRKTTWLMSIIDSIYLGMCLFSQERTKKTHVGGGSVAGTILVSHNRSGSAHLSVLLSVSQC
jgi:hypothetical protein